MMIAEIIRESTSTNNMSSVTSSQVLRWSKRGEAQRSLRMMMERLRQTKIFDTITTCRKQIHLTQMQTTLQIPRKHSKQ